MATRSFTRTVGSSTCGDRVEWSILALGDTGITITKRGYAIEAARAVVRFGFDTLGLHRLTAGCDAENFGSQGVIRKCGMQLEGRLRQHRHLDGVWRDGLKFGLLRDERVG